MSTKRDTCQHDEFCRGVEAVDVGSWIGLGVAQALRVGEDDVHRFAGCGHPTQDVVARAIENARHARERVAGKPFSHAVDERHTTANCGLETDPNAGARRGSQQFGTMSRQQHLVGGDYRSTALNRLADPVVGGVYTSNDFDNDIRRRVENLIVVFGPDHGRGHPVGAFSGDAAIEDVGQPNPTRQLGALDQNSRDRRAHGAEAENRDLERDFRLSALGLGSRLSALGSGLWA